MIAHEIEVGNKETSDFGRVSGINDADDVSFRLDAVGVGRSIRCIVSWLGITLVFQNADAGATSVGGVRVTFDV